MKHASQSTAFQEGYKAYQDEIAFGECDYDLKTQPQERRQWQDGWLSASDDHTYDD